MNNDCKKIQGMMTDLIFEALSGRDKEAVMKHVAGCEDCRNYMQSLRDEQRVLREFAKKVDSDMKRREAKMLEAIESCNIDESMDRIMSRRVFRPMKIAKMTVAATLLIAAGFFSGRFLAPPPVDIEQLQATLEPAIRRSVAEQLKNDRQLALERHTAQLKEDLVQQFHRDIKECAARTLTASRVATEQRLAELVKLIEAARAVDRLQIAAALECIESNRLQDNTRLGEGLIRLAAHKSNVKGNNQ